MTETATATDLFADGWLSSPPQYRTDLDRCEQADGTERHAQAAALADHVV